MLNIVKEIKEFGLDAVVSKYALMVKDGGHKILLKYHQIDSAFAKDVPAVRECRGLILEKSTLRPMSYPFYRFFNAGESCADTVDYSTARVYKKEDGSLIGLYWDWVLGEWAVQTSGTPDANTPVGINDITFRELFLSTLNCDLFRFNTDYCYMFELCTPLNVVVTPHIDSYVKVLAIRNMLNLTELSHTNVSNECSRLGLSQVDSYTFDVKNLVDIVKGLPAVEEGYVVCDAQFNRVKVKNPAYVALHHLKDSLSKSDLFEVIFKGEVDEVVALMPNFAQPLNDRYKFFTDTVATVSELLNDLHTAPYTTKKDFALWLQNEIKNRGTVLTLVSGKIYKYADNVIKYGDTTLPSAWELLTSIEPEKLESAFSNH